ncbi:class I SAM-dependent methyltransferase [Ferruginibacter sp.]
MGERTFDDFDQFANEYRSIHSSNVQLSGADSFYFVQMKVELVAGFEKDGPLNVLDIGCGDGATEFFMHHYFSSWQLEGIDVAEKTIAEAQEKNIPNSHFQLYNGRQLPFADNSIDIVYIACVLHHIDFSIHQTIMSEVYRVLKKGGRLYFFEHNPLNPVTRHLVNTCVFDKDAVLLKYTYAKKLLRQNNFASIQNRFIIFFPRKKFWKPFVQLEKYLTWLPLGGQYFLRAIK